jgi:hypothetical protein
MYANPFGEYPIDIDKCLKYIKWRRTWSEEERIEEDERERIEFEQQWIKDWEQDCNKQD